VDTTVETMDEMDSLLQAEDPSESEKNITIQAWLEDTKFPGPLAQWEGVEPVDTKTIVLSEARPALPDAHTVEVDLNPAVFNTKNYQSHAGAVIAYFSTGFLSENTTASNHQNDDYITDPPTKEVYITYIQTLVTLTATSQSATTQSATTRSKTERARVRECITSHSDGITVSDLSLHLNRDIGQQDVVKIETHQGVNSFVELPGVIVRQ
jgi:hypothetical protein